MWLWLRPQAPVTSTKMPPSLRSIRIGTAAPGDVQVEPAVVVDVADRDRAEEALGVAEIAVFVGLGRVVQQAERSHADASRGEVEPGLPGDFDEARLGQWRVGTRVRLGVVGL